jgi:hypothetical protein
LTLTRHATQCRLRSDAGGQADAQDSARLCAKDPVDSFAWDQTKC